MADWNLEDGESRTSITTGSYPTSPSPVWVTGDSIGIYPDAGGDQLSFRINEGGSKSCSFDGAVDANGNPVGYNVPEQEELNGGFMLDASIGKYIRLKNGKSLSINLSVNNILNNTNLRTGGYEQNRDDSYDDGEARTYVFSKNSKYYYAPACNAFLNIGYRF